MTATLCKAVIRKQNREDAYERGVAAARKVSEWVEMSFEWQTKQTAKAVLFPTYGWVPKVAIAWRKPDGRVVPWGGCGYDEDRFMLAGWFVKKTGLRP